MSVRSRDAHSALSRCAQQAKSRCRPTLNDAEAATGCKRGGGDATPPAKAAGQLVQKTQLSGGGSTEVLHCRSVAFSTMRTSRGPLPQETSCCSRTFSLTAADHLSRICVSCPSSIALCCSTSCSRADSAAVCACIASMRDCISSIVSCRFCRTRRADSRLATRLLAVGSSRSGAGQQGHARHSSYT